MYAEFFCSMSCAAAFLALHEEYDIDYKGPDDLEQACNGFNLLNIDRQGEISLVRHQRLTFVAFNQIIEGGCSWIAGRDYRAPITVDSELQEDLADTMGQCSNNHDDDGWAMMLVTAMVIAAIKMEGITSGQAAAVTVVSARLQYAVAAKVSMAAAGALYSPQFKKIRSKGNIKV
jgi:hypothetical protein